MSYVDKVKKAGKVYDIHDTRLEVTEADVGKVVSVNEEGELTLVDAPSGGTKLYRHELHNQNYTISGYFIDANPNTPTSYSELKNQLSTAIFSQIISYGGGPSTEFIFWKTSYNSTDDIIENLKVGSLTFDNIVFENVTKL